MFRKKCPVLTASTCKTMEMVRTSLEVLSGEHVSFICLDFNTSKGKVFIGDKENDLSFICGRDDLIDLLLEEVWYVALFEESNLVKVALRRGNTPVRSTVAGDLPMRWVGRSNTDRWEEPIFLREAEYCAEIRGITLSQLLGD